MKSQIRRFLAQKHNGEGRNNCALFPTGGFETGGFYVFEVAIFRTR
ncbi:MAG: hypothetical protein ABF449_09410 [Ethanoligenens sp.]